MLFPFIIFSGFFWTRFSKNLAKTFFGRTSQDDDLADNATYLSSIKTAPQRLPLSVVWITPAMDLISMIVQTHALHFAQGSLTCSREHDPGKERSRSFHR
jgi:hypothetical protein